MPIKPNVTFTITVTTTTTPIIIIIIIITIIIIIIIIIITINNNNDNNYSYIYINNITVSSCRKSNLQVYSLVEVLVGSLDNLLSSKNSVPQHVSCTTSVNKKMITTHTTAQNLY